MTEQKEATVPTVAKKESNNQHEDKYFTSQVSLIDHIKADVTGNAPAAPKPVAEKQRGLIDDLEAYISDNYSLLRNEITRFIERDGKPLQQKDLNTIYLSAKKRFPKLTYDLFERVLNSDLTGDYNPLKELIGKYKYREPKGVLRKLFDTIQSDTGFGADGTELFPDFVYHFGVKWYVGIIASIFGEHSALMFVLSGTTQGEGKTEWFRRLLPAPFLPYYAESKLDEGKDGEILLTRKLLVMNDEMGGATRKDERRTKELLSKQIITVREPYGKSSVDLQRLAVLCGTTNDNEILSDPTGNRRIIPVNVLSIDKDAYNEIDKLDALMEAYHLYKSGFDWHLSKDDVRTLNDVTGGFEKTSAERDLIIKYFRKPSKIDGGVFMVPTEIKATIERRSMQKISSTRLGLELKRWGCNKVAKKINGSTARGYFLIDREMVAELPGGCQEADNLEMPFGSGF
jgi:predicted P-loop ATPase